MSDAALNADAVAALEVWLAGAMPELAEVRIAAVDAPDHRGQSAETMFIDVSGARNGAAQTHRLVLRRQLDGFDLFLDSDLARQAGVLRRMADRPGIRVPEVIGVEQDRAVLGTPFLVMRRCGGRVVPQTPNYNLSGWLADLPAPRQQRVWTNLVEAMARVHAVDWSDGFAFLARDSRRAGLDEFLDDVARWFTWAARGREQPVADAALDWLRRNRPAEAATSVLWGDAIPANALFDDDLGVSALIDWEMAALGPGEIDLAWFLMFDGFFSTEFGVPRLAGLPDRAAIVASYEASAGRRVEHLDYYEVLAMLRLSIIMVRGCDRQIARGTIGPRSTAFTHNPATAMLARRLGLTVPEVGADFMALMVASGR